MKDKILNWFATGQVGLSSKSMACAAAGLPQDPQWGAHHPSDPDDFNRCLLLIDQVPEIREHFQAIAALSQTWARLIDRWDEVEKCFLDEVGFNWSKARRASKTYELMKEIGC
jgi:hypothetical protein